MKACESCFVPMDYRRTRCACGRLLCISCAEHTAHVLHRAQRTAVKIRRFALSADGGGK